MSTDTATSTDSATSSDTTATGHELELGGASVPYHWLAVGSLLVLVASYGSILYHVTDIVGGTTTLFALVAATLGAGVVVARRLRAYQAGLLAAGLLAVGIVAYYLAVPSAYLGAVSLGKVLDDNLALLTGLSVLRMTEVGAWALGIAPGLVFVPWYFVLRRRYALAVGTGGAALGFFVLTGDAGPVVALVGTLAGAATLGFGTMARRGATTAQVDTFAVVLVAMVLVTSSVSVVPGGGASPLLPGGSAGAPTVQGSLLGNDERVNVVGSIRLSPKVQFTVESNEPAYWRVGAYDRYDGGSWIRTGDSRAYRPARAPDGPTTRVSQTVTVKAKRLGSMPSAWKPTRLTSGGGDNARRTSLDGLTPIGALREGESYSVVSRMPNPTPAQLRATGTDYPDRIEQRYLQLPESSADRIRTRTDDIVAGERTPYAKAKAIENWLESNKRYSLDVERPEGDIAESFIFEMEAGYCTYYASSMVTMLRSQGVPARFVVGYTSGQRVAEDEWVVRGLDSHAWVEVYFPEVGWVQFDPTPAAPRQQSESSNVEQAREANVSNVDTGDSDEGTWTPTTTATTNPNETDGENETTASTSADVRPVDRERLGIGTTVSGGTVGEFTTATNGTAGGSDEGGWLPVGPPSKEQAAFGAFVLVGLFAAARRTGVAERVHREIWLRWQPRRDPDADVERAFRRLERLLGEEYRERRTGETPREYLAAIDELDDRARRVGDLYERARYAGRVDEGVADEAVSLVNELVSERRELYGRP